MSFDIASVVGRDTGSGINIANQTLLSFATGICQSGCFPVLVRAGVDDDGADLVVVRQSLVERFEDEAASAFTPSEARLCSVVESKSLAMLIEETAIMSTDARLEHRIAWTERNTLLTLTRTWTPCREAEDANWTPRQLPSLTLLSGYSALPNAARKDQMNRPCLPRTKGHEG